MPATPVHVIVLYGCHVKKAFDENYAKAVPGSTCSAAMKYRDVTYCVLTTPTRSYWLICSPHPAYPRRAGAIHAAVELAALLRLRPFPRTRGEVIDLTADDTEQAAVEGAMEASALVFGADEAAEGEDEEVMEAAGQDEDQ
jgi:hypothetical protein